MTYSAVVINRARQTASIILTILFILAIEPKLAVGSVYHAVDGDSQVLLTIRAKGADGLMETVHTFDRSTLEKLPQQTIRTKTPWTDGISEFSGPLVTDVLTAAGRRGSILRCIALNDYSVDIPVEDVERYPVILAMRKDGKVMSTREKGPLWIIFPWSDNTSLWTESYFSRSIWQLKEIELHR